jgi:PAS domain S-box-containing protein
MKFARYEFGSLQPEPSPLRLLLDHSGIGFVERRFVEASVFRSPAFMRIFGLECDTQNNAVLISRLIHESDRARVAEVCRNALERPNEPFYRVSFRINRASDAEERLVHAAGRVRFGQGGALGTVSLFHDMTDIIEKGAANCTKQLARDARVPSACLRAARGLLDWSVQELADAAKVSISTVRRLEGEQDGTPVTPATGARIREALEAAGVGFLITSAGLIAICRE